MRSMGPEVGSSSKEWKTLSFTFECPGREAQQSRMVAGEYTWSSMESLVTSVKGLVLHSDVG